VEKRSTGGRVRRIGLANVQLDGEITLTFTNIDTEQLLKLRTHWILARGTTLEFALPADLFPSMNFTRRALLMATTWRHKEKPKVVDICGGQPDFLLHSLELTLIAQPRRVASPVVPMAPILSLPVVPVTAPGAHWRVGAVFAPGKAGINAISLPGAAWVLSPVWLPGAAGTPGNINAPGAAWAVSVEIGAGARTTPSAALNITTAWATGKASVGGIAPGAAWTIRVGWVPGKGSVSLLQAPGAALAAAVAWAPGVASITGGTAPGALLALGTAWQPGGAQGIGPGAAWSVSVVWVGGAGSVPGTGDSTFSNNSLLLTFDGTVGSNAAPLDRSNNALTLSVEGTANRFTISETQFKYGQAGFFNEGARVVVPETSLLSFPGDFELQTWFYMLSRGSAYSTMLELGFYNDGIMIRPGAADSGIWVNSFTKIANSNTTLDALSLNAWNHIALSRIGTTLRIHFNGTQAHEVQGFTGTINGGVRGSYIGDSTHVPGRFFNGYIDDLRIKKGVSTITGNFTPTGPHPTS
jgi:hypothetical protein